MDRAFDSHRIAQHVMESVQRATEGTDPFMHLQLADVFPEDVYAAMLEALPRESDYRPMSGRSKEARRDDGVPTRTKMDLLPEFIRHMSPEQKAVWRPVGDALTSIEVTHAFQRRLAPGLLKRFGDQHQDVRMYPIPVLTRDVAGYKIGVHPDTRRKAMTIQLYLPRDRSIEHVGTAFHRKVGDKKYEQTYRMPFAPNVGYAFAVGSDTYHSVETVGPEVVTRDSILLTYFVDQTLAHKLYNRGKRFGNMVRNEVRGRV
jgi:hypothetical protein